MASTLPRPIAALLIAAVLLPTVLSLGGCDVIAYTASRFEGEEGPRDVAAQYTGLTDQTVAVMVLTDESVRYRYPDAAYNLCLTMSRDIAQNVAGVTTIDPEAVSTFQRENPYWSTVPPSRLIERYNVDRLVLVDVAEYRTREPGNAHLWKGVIDGSVSVYEAESADPDNRAFEQRVRAEFPQSGTFGLTEGDPQTIQIGMLKLFTDRAAGLFYDHQEP